MMRLNFKARENLHVGQRVQTDLRGRPEEILTITRLYEQDDATDHYAAEAVDAAGKSVTPHPTAACWFWPAGTLERVVDVYDSSRREKFELRGRLLDAKNAIDAALKVL